MSHTFSSGRMHQLTIATSKKLNVDSLDGVVVENYSLTCRERRVQEGSS